MQQYDDFFIGQRLPDLREEPFGSIALTVVFLTTGLPENGFCSHRENSLLFGMKDTGGHQLVMVLTSL